MLQWRGLGWLWPLLATYQSWCHISWPGSQPLFTSLWPESWWNWAKVQNCRSTKVQQYIRTKSIALLLKGSEEKMFIWPPPQLTVKEPKWKSSQNVQFRAHFCRNSKFFFLHGKWSRGHILTVLWKIVNRGTPRKSGFFQERGRKRVKEWGDVTFMKEWVKALDKTRILAPADIKFVVSFPRYGHLKIPKGPNQISLVYFRAS